MVNPGAIATTSLVPGRSADEKWRFLQDGLSRFAGRELSLDEEVYESASEHQPREPATSRLCCWDARAHLLGPGRGRRPLHEAELPGASAPRDLAGMGATLADGGVNPVSGRARDRRGDLPFTLAVMTTAGLYETSGRLALRRRAPGQERHRRRDRDRRSRQRRAGHVRARCWTHAGNSVKGQLAARFLAQSAGLDIFASAP